MVAKRDDDGTAAVNKLLGVRPPAAPAATTKAAAPAAKAAQVDVYGKGNRLTDGTLKSNNPAMTAAIDAAYKEWQDSAKTKFGTRDEGNYGRTVVTGYGVSEKQALENQFKKAGLDPKLIPERADLAAYKSIGQYNGVGADPLALLRNTQRYEDGRTVDEANTRDFIAKGLANGKSDADIWKDVGAYNDSTRGKNAGLVNNISNGISHVGKVVAENPLVQTAISLAASAYGIPPNVTMALLSANNIGQGQSVESVVKGIAMQYAGGKLGDMAGGAAKGAMAGSGLGDTVTKGITSAASGAAKGVLNSAVNGGDVLSGALKGSVSGLASAAGGAATDASGNQLVGDLANIGTTAALSGKGINANSLVSAGLRAAGRTDTFKDISDGVSDKFKDLGLDSLNVGGVDIPGGMDLKGNLVPGLNAKDATLLASQANPALGKVVKTLQKPTLSGIAALTHGAAPAKTAVRRPPIVKPTVLKPQPPAAVLAALNKIPPKG